MFKRITAILLVLLLSIGHSSFAMTGLTPHQLDTQKPSIKSLNLQTSDFVEMEPEEEVRVIIELDGDAPIETATKKGVKYEKLAKSERKGLEIAAKNKQKNAKNKIRGKKVNIEYLHEFNTVVNGFSANIKYGDIAKIKEIPEVKEVYFATEYRIPTEEPEMKYSKELVEAQQAWRNFGYDGNGMVVGIIDSGIDPNHKDFIISNLTTLKLTENKVNEVINEYELPGQYFNEKIPYGWNYMDETPVILDGNPNTDMHGMHVAGTVGANGNEETDGIKGIAPEAQLLALRVFGENTSTTYSDIYIKAIDDAIKLGVDVLNMSLGAPAGFVDHDSPEQRAVKRAVDNGVVVSISAGNSNYFGNGFFYPYASNPDYGVVGTPSVSYHSTSVASFENSFMDVDAVEVSIDGGKAETVMFLSAGQNAPTVGESFELVYAGLGYPEDFAGKDLDGKYALVQRGEIGFIDKALNAQNAGAAGIFIYNNTDGTVNMASDPAIVIPQLFMLKSDGDRFASALQEGQAVTVNFNGGKMTIPNIEAGKMSSFSSWGTTPNLDFKPEITAPGGQIYSTINNDEYAVKSGTSMAAPHVAGGSALVLQRVDEQFNLDGFDRSKLAKTFLLNTAMPIEFDGAPVSPRRQGAGLMQLHAALTTPVIVTDSNTGEAKVALKEINDNVVTFTLTAKNFSDEAISYNVSANAQTDAPVNAGGGLYVSAPDLFGAIDLGAITKVNGETVSTIEVPANGTTTFDISIDVSDWDETLKTYFTNGYWLEGFVKLSDPTDSNPDLVVPYVGFKGNWNDAPILDAPIWDELLSFYESTGIVTHVGGGIYNYLGVDQATGSINPDYIAISPNGDGTNDSATYKLSFLRNAENVTLKVVNDKGRVIKEIVNLDNVRKNFYDNDRYSYYYLYSDWTWDGTRHNGKIAPEGQYYLQVEASIDYEEAETQTFTFPVKLDVTPPKVKTKLEKDRKTITVNLSDKTSGVAYWYVVIDGVLAVDTPFVNGETSFILDEEAVKGQKIEVIAVDHAGNMASETVKIHNGGKDNGKGKGNK